MDAVAVAAPHTPLVDGFGRAHRYLRIAVTDRCNLRCLYCMPAGGVLPMPGSALLSDDEIVRVAGVLARYGVDRIRLTGGEPLARAGLPALAARLAALPGVRTLGITTNGTLLARFAADLHAAGVQRVNISLDTLREDRFARITLRARLRDVRAGIDAACALPFARVKLNVVVMRGVNDDELRDFTDLARTTGLTVRFIEYMPFASNGWHQAGCVPWTEMRDAVAAHADLTPLTPDAFTGVAREFLVDGGPARIGFISAMSEHFCDACDRLRLTADGALKSCLFLPAEQDLRAPLRAGIDDDELAALVSDALTRKPWAHAPAAQLQEQASRGMIHIGG